MKRRSLQLAEVVKRVLVRYVQVHPLCDAEGRSIVTTITQVRLSVDLRWADVFIAPLYGQTISTEDFSSILHDAHKPMRYYLSQNAELKRTPQLRLIYDHSFDTAMRTEQLLRSVVKDDSS